MFEVRNEATGAVVGAARALGRACDQAEALMLNSKDHFAVVRVEMVFTTRESNPQLRPAAEMACAIMEHGATRLGNFRNWLRKVWL